MPTKITFTRLPASNSNGLYLPDEGVWNDYWIRNSYFTDGQRWMMPISSPGGFQGSSVAFVQMSSQTLLWMCQWVCEKQWELPDLPDPEALNDGNWVFLDQQIDPEMVQLAPDGTTLIFRVRGAYWFGHKNPSAANLIHPQAAWFKNINPVELVMNREQFKPGTIDAAPGGTGRGVANVD